VTQLRIGMLGAARVARYAMIAPAAAAPRATLVAVAARDGARAVAYAKAHAIARAFGAYDALLADSDIDLVYIATPPVYHAALALAAIGAGKHALVEKPFAMNAAEAAGVLAAAKTAGVRVFEAMHSRHHALHARLGEIVGAGEIGAVREIAATFTTPTQAHADDDFRWRADLGGGALMDLGVYPLAWTRALLGEDFVVASATMRGADADRETRATLRFASGAVARIHAQLDAETLAATMTVQGDAGRIEAFNPLAPQMGCQVRIETASGTREESPAGPGTFDAQLAAVCATLLDGADWPLPEDDPVRSMSAIDAVRAAAR